ncbi:hypothetical protein [Mucilaginibacter psychrotolerans]|uniref:YhhN-like protein n=1 Tax=Mucilaginibacter psychrotolerans TaxID=1524096 RepID=A0A4Y8SEG3_9SPHI|nr:hypothetical protein [Mucilaginibacter psychrotolerans]TFF37483.1 hypothetical protein E2R66_11800 [Mucilaginibacter psychrotolerans]
MSVVRFILIASNAPPLLAGAFAAIYFKKFDGKLFSFKLFLLFNSGIQILQLVLSNLKLHNLFLLHIAVPVEFTLLAYFYYASLEKYIDKKIFFTGMTLFLLFSFVNSTFIQPISTFNSHSLIVEALVLIILSIFTFIVLLDPRSGMHQVPMGKTVALINSGIFINFSTTLLIYYFSNFLIKNADEATVNYIWVYNDLASVAMYIFFIVAIWKHIKQK